LKNQSIRASILTQFLQNETGFAESGDSAIGDFFQFLEQFFVARFEIETRLPLHSVA
jgi:hypothetical protein